MKATSEIKQAGCFQASPDEKEARNALREPGHQNGAGHAWGWQAPAKAKQGSKKKQVQRPNNSSP